MNEEILLWDDDVCLDADITSWPWETCLFSSVISSSVALQVGLWPATSSRSYINMVEKDLKPGGGVDVPQCPSFSLSTPTSMCGLISRFLTTGQYVLMLVCRLSRNPTFTHLHQLGVLVRYHCHLFRSERTKLSQLDAFLPETEPLGKLEDTGLPS